MGLGEDEIKEVIANLPPEVKEAMEKHLLGASKTASEILKAIKAKGWVIGDPDFGAWPEDREFTEANDIEVMRLIDIEIEKSRKAGWEL